MPERPTAERQLARLLYVLPVAARAGGASLSELGERLGTDRRELLRELEREITGREYYLPAGAADDLQLAIEGDRVRLWTKSEFKRPVRLSPREALALGLGIRARAAAAAVEERGEMLGLARRFETELASRPPDALLPRVALDAEGSGIAGLRALLIEAARRRRHCRIRYLKSGADALDDRVVRPYVLVCAGNRWYLLAHCCRNEDVRAFRLDRILEAEEQEAGFEPPADFDPAEYLDEGRVYHAHEDVEVVVRYSARIAPWIREHGPAAEEQPDGGVLLRHRVADPGWAVSHVLQFAGDAELLEPADLRQLVARSAERLLADR